MQKSIVLILPILILLNIGAVNEKYSYRDFMNQDLKKVDSKELSGTTIVGSCFYQEAKKTASTIDEIVKDIWPKGTEKVRFERCNLDNVKLPDGSTIDERTTNKIIKPENDGDDWVLNSDLSEKEKVKDLPPREALMSIDS